MKDRRWWLTEDTDEASALCYSVAQKLWSDDSSRRDRHATALSRYRGDPIDFEATEGDLSRANTADTFLRRRTTENAVLGNVLAMRARITRNRPRVRVSTTGGDWRAWTSGRMATQWLDGLFEARRVYELLENRTVLDALLFDSAYVLVVDDDGHDLPLIERLRPQEVLTDPAEEYSGTIRTIYLIRHVDAGVLAARFHKQKEQIDVQQDALESEISTAGVSKIVQAVEAWHLPSSPGAKDGRHLICLQDTSLLDEPWEDDEFPIAQMAWRPNPECSTGISLAEDTLGWQAEIDNVTTTINDSYHLCVPHFLVPLGGPVESLNNRVGAVIKFDPQIGPPVLNTPNAVSPDLLMRADTLARQSRESNGISQLSSSMQKPAGINSGVALQNYHDVESERHTPVLRDYERLVADIARKSLRAAARMLKRSKDSGRKSALTVHVGKTMVRDIKYAAIAVSDREHIVRAEPTSALAFSTAARMQQINDLWDRGVISSHRQYLSLLSVPDLERFEEQELTGEWEVDEIVDSVIDGADIEDIELHGNMDHQYLRKRAQSSRSIAKRRGAPEKVLEVFNQIIALADGYIDRAIQGALQAQAAAPPATPTGVGPL